MPCPSPGDLPEAGTEPSSLALQADSLPSELPGKKQGLKKKNAFVLIYFYFSGKFFQEFTNTIQMLKLFLCDSCTFEAHTEDVQNAGGMVNLAEGFLKERSWR